jgi:hypothetical protein
VKEYNGGCCNLIWGINPKIFVKVKRKIIKNPIQYTGLQADMLTRNNKHISLILIQFWLTLVCNVFEQHLCMPVHWLILSSFAFPRDRMFTLIFSSILRSFHINNEYPLGERTWPLTFGLYQSDQAKWESTNHWEIPNAAAMKSQGEEADHSFYSTKQLKVRGCTSPLLPHIIMIILLIKYK